jgi:hypothetical protein
MEGLVALNRTDGAPPEPQSFVTTGTHPEKTEFNAVPDTATHGVTTKP